MYLAQIDVVLKEGRRTYSQAVTVPTLFYRLDTASPPTLRLRETMGLSQHQARPPLWTAQLPVKEDGTPGIRRLMVASRGEIACRVFRTCRMLDITSVAVYAQEYVAPPAMHLYGLQVIDADTSPRDADSRHLTEADRAIELGSINQPAGNPFLNIQLLIDTALSAGVEAIHPGYGYLSENAQFADAVREAGLIFVGPSSFAMSTLGDKRQAKEYLAKNEPSVPLIPGWTGSGGEAMDLDELERQAERIGYPVMLKASAGGGGKGMRIVREASSLRSDLERAQSESQRSFGSSECILEKYIEAGKHVEVQIMGDSDGTVLSLWERDCSVQRRHQKVIEETPCPWLSQEKREEICATAVRIGKLLGYENAGTVEFILDVKTSNFYFLEVNARLQVEHPITEECTGLDLVSIQLFVALGGKLAEVAHLQKIPQYGHAIECRLCAEDPIRDFAPQHGIIRHWSESSPAAPRDVRFETAVRSGTGVSIHFDSMIAKVVAWAPTRAKAIERMAKTLAETACMGIATNQLFLQSCLLNPNFQRPDYTTSFIPDNLETLLNNPYLPSLGVSQSSLSALPCLLLRQEKASDNARYSERQVFGSVRQGFRNQHFDKVNLPSDIVTTYDAKEGAEINAMVCTWKYSGQTSGKDGVVQIAPLAVSDGDSGVQDEKAPQIGIATKSYTALSTAIRQGTLANAETFHVSMSDRRLRTRRAWSTGRIEVNVEGKSLSAHVAFPRGASEPDAGGFTPVLVHFLSLGTPMIFRCYSTLSYFESLQRASENASASSNFINAPMPCKVLRILKKAGDEVKAGEIVMLVESMKMEISISAGQAGKFQTTWSEGDAVDEGLQLCILE